MSHPLTESRTEECVCESVCESVCSVQPSHRWTDDTQTKVVWFEV